MKDFSECLVGSWFMGVSPEIGSRLVVVEFQRRFLAYFVDLDHVEEFVEWISKDRDNCDFDNIPRLRDDGGKFAETARQHLARIGCNLTLKEWQF